MMSTIILSMSVVLQFIAALLSFRLRKTTRRWEAWCVFSVALTLMGVSGSIALYRSLMGDISSPSDIPQDLITLGFFALLAAGLSYIRRLFVSLAAANQTLHQREARLLDDQRAAKLGIIEFDFRDGSASWSDEIYRRYGLNKDNFTPTYENIFDFIHADDRDRVRAQIEAFRLSKSGEVLDIDFRTMASGKDVMYIHSVGIVEEKDLDGEIIRIRFVSQNITGQMLAGEALQKSESSLTEAQRVAHIGSWEWDATSKVSTWSDEVFRIFGLEPQPIELNFDTVQERIHRDDAQAMTDAMTRCLKYRTPYDVEYRCVRPNGEIRNCHSQGKVILDDAGKVIKLVGSIQDITERTQAASASREREEQLQLGAVDFWL